MIQKPNSAPDVHNSISLKIGRMFEAHATGWGVVAVPVVPLVMVLAVALEAFPG